MKPLASPNVLPLAAATLMVFALVGCGRDSVKVYKVETNDTMMPTTAATAMPAMPAMPVYWWR